jgi:O-acetyl-ADP-ribose deacetylase (regulator of RNase III)
LLPRKSDAGGRPWHPLDRVSSCGLYGYPVPAAAQIAVDTTAAFLAADQTLTEVIFTCFGPDVLQALQAALNR